MAEAQTALSAKETGLQKMAEAKQTALNAKETGLRKWRRRSRLR